MTGFSPGLAQGCFELIEIASRNILTFSEINASFPNFGNISAYKVISTTQRLGWLLTDENGIASITPLGLRLLNITGYEAMLRQALLDYIDKERPPWIQNATYGRSRVIRFAGSDLAQVIIEAGLATGSDDDVVLFWDTMAALARGQKNARNSEIGRQGERLSIEFEKNRTGRKPKWVAIDNNNDGYDLLSIVDTQDLRLLSIEVKASTLGLSGSLHLSRNEWDRSQETENHAFHLWAIEANGNNLLAILTPSEFKNHIPTDSGKGSWESVEIPFSEFHSYFQTN
jgi:hypothetical protein